MSKPAFLTKIPVYQQLSEGEYQTPSIYIAAVKKYTDFPTENLLRQRLEKVILRQDICEILEVRKEENGSFKIVLTGNEEETFLYHITFNDNTDSDEWHYDSANYRNRNLLEDERLEMHLAPQTVECFTFLNLENPYADLMIQFAVLDAIAGECYALVDGISALFFSGAWLAEMATSYTPPNPNIHYTIHAVSPENPDDANYWLHTHGLLKFGLPELEILNGRKEALYVYETLLNGLATQLLNDPKHWLEDELLVAYSQDREIWIKLLPWQEAVISDLLIEKKGFFRKTVVPFNGDMTDRQAPHDEPSMVLFASINNQLRPLNDYGATLEGDHCMVMLPDAETERMSTVAREKLNLFTQCFKRYPPQEEQWGYIMKFACTSEQTEATEHMWFDVLELDDKQAKVKLINQPYNIPEMQEGEIYDLSLENLTYWVIYSAPMQTQIDPDSAFELRRFLNRN